MCSLTAKDIAKLQMTSEGAGKISKFIQYLPYRITPLKAEEQTKYDIVGGNYANALGCGKIGADFVCCNEASAYSLDADTYHELVDNLALFSVLEDKGINCKSLSLLDKFYE